MEFSNHGLTQINTDKMNAPLTPSLSPPGGERVATSQVKGLLFQIRVHPWSNLFCYSDLRAQLFNFTIFTIRFARAATAAPVPNQPVTEQRPLLLRHENHHVPLNFVRRGLFRQAKPTRKPRHVRVHDDADVEAEGIAQNDIRRFASDTVQLRQLLHRLRDIPAMVFDKFAAAVSDVLCLIAEKARRLDGLLQFGERRIRIIRHRAIFFKQLFRDNIDAFIGALRGKDGGDEQFERFRVTQLAARFGISSIQRGDDSF